MKVLEFRVEESKEEFFSPNGIDKALILICKTEDGKEHVISYHQKPIYLLPIERAFELQEIKK